MGISKEFEFRAEVMLPQNFTSVFGLYFGVAQTKHGGERHLILKKRQNKSTHTDIKIR